MYVCPKVIYHLGTLYRLKLTYYPEKCIVMNNIFAIIHLMHLHVEPK